MKNTLKLGVCLAAFVFAVAMTTPAFADDFNPALYTLNLTNGSNGHVDGISSSGFHLVGSDGAGCCSLDTSYSTTLAGPETISFDWNAHSNDIDGFPFDPFSIKINGVNVVYVGSGYDASGSLSFNLNAGDTLAFDIFSTDGCCGPGTATITNYNETPEPGSMFLLGTGLIGLGGSLRRKIRL